MRLRLLLLVSMILSTSIRRFLSLTPDLVFSSPELAASTEPLRSVCFSCLLHSKYVYFFFLLGVVRAGES